MSDFEVVDWKEQEIRPSMRCLYGEAPPFNETDENGLSWEDYVVIVKSISDPDGDVDDYGRSRLICPYVTVEFPSGVIEQVNTHRTTVLTWADYPDGPEMETFQADDLEVLDVHD